MSQSDCHLSLYQIIFSTRISFLGPKAVTVTGLSLLTIWTERSSCTIPTFSASGLYSAHHVRAVAAAAARAVAARSGRLLPEVVKLDEVRGVPVRQELRADLEEVLAVHSQSCKTLR